MRRSLAPALAGVALTVLTAAAGCGRASRPDAGPSAAPPVRPWVLLVTLDTTRADAVGPEARGVETPAFNALAARGLRFRRAYATVPETLPAHSSLMTGLYPAGHGVHENARALPATHPVLAERLRQAGYRTAAFVSSFVLARRFGLARGFDAYDDALPAGRSERTSAETTERALAHLRPPVSGPLFLWVHYFDPHAPYTPPEPFRTRYAARPYLGEVAAMDADLGRLVQAFERSAPSPPAIAVVGDHGEGLGDHGEAQHGNLVYDTTMRVPLVLLGPGVAPAVHDGPVSTRRVFHTVLQWAGLGGEGSLLGAAKKEVVLGEGMKPFLSYGWQPQIMAVQGAHKAISAGRLEAYDVLADPGETRDVAATADLPRSLRTALREYPVPSPGGAPTAATLGEEDKRRLASLGYVSTAAAPPVRKDAPRPADMVALFDLLERASFLFVEEKYARAIPILKKILSLDAANLDAALRLATAYSSLGREAPAEAAFERARRIAPGSPDVRTYLGLHYARTARWERAVPLLEQVVREAPDRLPAVEALAVIRQRQGRIPEAIELRQRILAMREATAAELVQLGRLAMSAGQTEAAIDSLEKARRAQGERFAHHLELGVLYLAARRLEDAREALDRVPSGHAEYPMALFKRAQVSVLLLEPDRAARIDAARRRADATTRPLIERERLFQTPSP